MKTLLSFLLAVMFGVCHVQADDVVVKINFCGDNATTTNPEWNNFSNFSNVSAFALPLNDVNGKLTDMTIKLTESFNGTNVEGVQSTETPLSMTSKESYSAFWSQASGSKAKAEGSFVFNGLDPEAEYDFVVFGSRKGQTDNRETLYTFEGANTLSATLDCSSNASNVAEVIGVKPESSGSISLTLKPGANNNNSLSYYYINALQITQRGGGNSEPVPVIRILAIGNSFSEDAVEQNLYDLAKEAGIKVIIGNAYRGGQGFQSHWNDVVNKNNTFEYRKMVNGARMNTKGQSLASIVTDEPWDFITFQQVSQESGMYSTFEPYLGYLIDYVKGLSTNSAVKYGYHMTWAYAQNATHSGFVNYDNDQKKMYESILLATQKALEAHPELSFMIPSGTAIQNARTSYIGDNMNRDGYHLNLSIGRYTAACTWLESVLGVNPVGLTYRPATLDEMTASVGQKAAHLAVQSPYAVCDMSEEGYAGNNTIVPSAININFGDSPTTSSLWNNITSQNTIVTNLKDVDENDSEVTIMLNDAFNGTNALGMTSTNTLLNMPEDVSKSCFWGYCQGNFDNNAHQPTGGFVFSHLNKDLTYDFTFYASRSGCSDNRETSFCLVGSDTHVAILDAASNSDNTITLNDVCPDQKGTISLTVSPGSRNTNTYKFYYINALQINAHESESLNVVSPKTTSGEFASPFVYNLQAQRLNSPQKGMNIINGQCVLVK